MLKRDWLKARYTGIGGSDVSALLGLNPWKTNVDVWEGKVFKMRDNISNNDAIKYGNRAERPLIDLFKLDYPKYSVYSKRYEIKRNKDYDYFIGSLDGELIEKETGRKGVLEIKTTSVLSSMAREKWKDKIPNNYYIQCLWYLLVTGWDFVVLKAQLKSEFAGSEVYLQTKHYYFERSEVEEDLQLLKEKGIEFWEKHVLTKREPPLVLPSI